MFKYTYDAFNRLVKAQRAYRDSGGTVQAGSTLTTYAYDGGNRRVSRLVENSGALANPNYRMVFHYAGSRVIQEAWEGILIEPLKQHVWGLTYIDELVETTLLETYTSSTEKTYKRHFALLDTKYCVMGLVDDAGDYVERYEYTPDGRRQVYVSAGANDPDAQTPTSQAPRFVGTGFGDLEYALCTIGFQGLMHDEVTGNIYQRAREYSPRLGRFMQRDPLGYPDGMNSYAAYHVLYGGVDPSGMDMVGYWTGVMVNQQQVNMNASPPTFEELDASVVNLGNAALLASKAGNYDSWRKLLSRRRAAIDELTKRVKKLESKLRKMQPVLDMYRKLTKIQELLKDCSCGDNLAGEVRRARQWIHDEFMGGELIAAASDLLNALNKPAKLVDKLNNLSQEAGIESPLLNKAGSVAEGIGIANDVGNVADAVLNGDNGMSAVLAITDVAASRLSGAAGGGLGPVLSAYNDFYNAASGTISKFKFAQHAHRPLDLMIQELSRASSKVDCDYVEARWAEFKDKVKRDFKE